MKEIRCIKAHATGRHQQIWPDRPAFMKHNQQIVYSSVWQRDLYQVKPSMLISLIEHSKSKLGSSDRIGAAT